MTRCGRSLNRHDINMPIAVLNEHDRGTRFKPAIRQFGQVEKSGEYSKTRPPGSL